MQIKGKIYYVLAFLYFLICVVTDIYCTYVQEVLTHFV